MSDIVIEDDLSALAAEYVLGTLEPDERTHANVLLDVDHGFRGLVRTWERRLGELHLMVEPVQPDAKVWERIKDKLGPLPLEVLAPLPAISPDPSPPAVSPDLPPQAISFDPPPPPTSHEEPSPVSPEPQLTEPPDSAIHAERLAELVHEVEKLAEEVHADAAMPKAEPEAAGETMRGLVGLAEAPLVTTPQVTTAKLRPQTEIPERERRAGRWGAVALVMSVIAIVLSGLIAAWKLVPDRLPEWLRPGSVFNVPESHPPPERAPPPVTQFEE